MVIRFLPKDEELDECEIRVVGPVMEELPDLDREELALVLEAGARDRLRAG